MGSAALPGLAWVVTLAFPGATAAWLTTAALPGRGAAGEL